MNKSSQNLHNHGKLLTLGDNTIIPHAEIAEYAEIDGLKQVET